MSLGAKKALFLDSVHSILQEQLQAMGYTCEHYHGAEKSKIIALLPDFQILIIRSKVVIDEEIINAGTQLTHILRSGSGLENIDVKYAATKGITCINSPEGNADAVAEHTLALILTMLNKICTANEEVKKGIWKREENRGTELSTKTVGLLGYGVMGKAVAERLSCFGCEIIFLDPKVNQPGRYGRKTNEKEFFNKVDILSIHVNYTKENYHFVSTSFLRQFKKPIYLVNTARGKVVDSTALIHAIEQGIILGAALDVNEFENHNFQQEGNIPKLLQKLMDCPQIILTPHVAGWTNESYEKLSSVLANKLKLNLGEN